MDDRRRWGISRTMLLLSQFPMQLYAGIWGYTHGSWFLPIFAGTAAIFCVFVMTKTVRAAVRSVK
jgi:hypothetical protein